MPEAAKCRLCGQCITEKYLLDHIVDSHEGAVLDYLNKKVVITGCPRKGCEVLHNTKDLTPSSICSLCGYPVGRWAYRWAARFIAASN